MGPMKALSRVPPLAYLGLYLLMIPLFGVIYDQFVPHDFYAPYARYEPGRLEDGGRIARNLAQMVRQDTKNEPKDYWTLDHFQLDPATIWAANLDLNENRTLAFDVIIAVRDTDPNAIVTGFGLPLNVSFPILTPPIAADVNYSYFKPMLNTDKNPGFPEELQKDAFKLIFQGLVTVHAKGPDDVTITLKHGNSPEAYPVLRVDSQTQTMIFEYFFGTGGDPARITGHLFRMIYLSAVVITTLGLGDIVPMTTASRSLVATEAVTGIVLAGLFFNAIAYRASQKS